jgi:hypothetical protein
MMEAVSLPKSHSLPAGLVDRLRLPTMLHQPLSEALHNRANRAITGKERKNSQPSVFLRCGPRHEPLVHFRSEYRQCLFSSGGYVIGREQNIPLITCSIPRLPTPAAGQTQERACTNMLLLHRICAREKEKSSNCLRYLVPNRER